MATPSPNGVARFRIVVVAAIVSILLLVVIAVVTLSVVGTSTETTPALTTITSVAVPVIVALLALLRTEQVREKVNGHMRLLTTIATEAAAQTGDPSLAEKAAEAQRIVEEHGQ